jgi:Dolichyl-phosphate-mannose-protein mannosyltransferase
MTESTSSRSTPNICQAWIGKYYRLAVLLFALNAISALLFILFINRMAYDDQYNLADVHRYASEGVSANNLRAHINPAGPTGFIWMAVATRMFPADELQSARAAILISWLLLGAGILRRSRYTRFPSLWYAALFVILAFPHAVTAALHLTEGPALLFATLGTLLWVEYLSQPTDNLNLEPLGIAAGVSISLAITCRQLLPAAVLFALPNGGSVLRGLAQSRFCRPCYRSCRRYYPYSFSCSYGKVCQVQAWSGEVLTAIGQPPWA